MNIKKLNENDDESISKLNENDKIQNQEPKKLKDDQELIKKDDPLNKKSKRRIMTKQKKVNSTNRGFFF